MIHIYKGKELHEEDGWYDAFDLCHIIGFHSPRDTIRRYVSKKDQCVVGLDTYVNENGLWSLVFAPTVRKDTKKDISKWLRGILEYKNAKEYKKSESYNYEYSDVENEKVSVKITTKLNKEVHITIIMN